jgi:hypothetical protein
VHFDPAWIKPLQPPLRASWGLLRRGKVKPGYLVTGYKTSRAVGLANILPEEPAEGRMTVYETVAQHVLSRRPIVIFHDRGNEAQREWIVFWEEDPQSQQKTPMTWNNELTTEEDRLIAIREDVLLKRADAKGAIELFTRKKVHWENELKKAEARYTATCEYFIYVYTKNIEYFQKLSDEQPAPAMPSRRVSAAAAEAVLVDATLKWLCNKERLYITRHTEPEKAVVKNGAMEFWEPAKSEWRITKSVASIYRELCEAAENGKIPFAKSAIADFMINYLKMNDGTDITKDSLIKADERTKPDKTGQNNKLLTSVKRRKRKKLYGGIEWYSTTSHRPLRKYGLPLSRFGA